MTNKESSIFAHIGSLYLKELESRRIFHFRKSLYFTLGKSSPCASNKL